MSARNRAPLLVWPMEAWPEGDRLRWQEGMDTGDPFARRYAARLSAATVNNARKAHGRFLAILTKAGVLDRSARPHERLNRDHAKLFVRELLACGNTHNSIYARVQSLLCAMRILEPDTDFRWLIGKLDQLTIERGEITVYDSDVLEAWGHELMERALASPDPAYRRIWYRNGLIIVIFATSAPRLRAMSSMRLGKHIMQMRDGAWELCFTRRDVKTKRLMDYAMPERLWQCVDRYVAHERVELLNGKMGDHFWAGRFGEKLGARGIEGMIRRASKEKFGVAFGPHRFRHCLATKAALLDDQTPGLAASILGITEEVVAEHYNKARKTHVFERFQAKTEATRAEFLSREEEVDDEDIVNHVLGLS